MNIILIITYILSVILARYTERIKIKVLLRLASALLWVGSSLAIRTDMWKWITNADLFEKEKSFGCKAP